MSVLAGHTRGGPLAVRYSTDPTAKRTPQALALPTPAFLAPEAVIPRGRRRWSGADPRQDRGTDGHQIGSLHWLALGAFGEGPRVAMRAMVPLDRQRRWRRNDTPALGSRHGWRWTKEEARLMSLRRV
jgi:hypothetical protein